MTKTHEYFIGEVKELYKNEYEILSIYSGATKKVKIKHLICNHEYEVTPNNLLRGRKCPKCFGINKYEFTYVKNYIEEFKYHVNTLASEYKNNRTKISVICPNGHDWLIDFKQFKKGTRCIVCKNRENGINIRLKEDFVREFIENINYKLLSPYVKSIEKIYVECEKGHQSYMYWGNLRKGERCHTCEQENKSIRYRKPFEEVNQYFESRNCVLLSTQYTNWFEVLEYICSCGNKDSKSLCNFKKSLGCSFCSPSSKGEEKVKEFLFDNDIVFKKQMRFVDCKDKYTLAFDFAIFDNSENLQILIEYDGEQHYQSIKYFGGNESFKKQQMHDKIKTDYCTKNNIPLLRIPYWEFDNIEEILRSNLKDMLLFIA